MKVRREIASIPKRSATQTWTAIVDLITGAGTIDKKTLESAASIMESLIADEQPAKKPIVVKGVGSRLVIYLLYGEDAMEADLSVDKLSWNPTAGDWSMSAPSDPEDVDWMNKALKDRAPRIKVQDVNAASDDEESASGAQAVKIDWGALN
ncbi:hypothetical protein KEU06_25425 [Pseudaminobacter sp. 19-2017]|uniref:Uncharacterized protein n=1 Tax=Pseudaminobacter soli (ex Zhang et al. 2022) TaxID=2831468 RepID=A0A942IBU3_9HYPH|nr:hypothetical protein [Pseudaminobacter soli]MBS3651951.1 hypothetical protein [Pseudaminobacter soli]